MSKKKVLITGSCGFIFSNFLRRAIYEMKTPTHFVSIDMVTANAINSMYWNKNHTFHVADIRDQHILDVIFKFEQPDVVIHGAAETVNADNFITSNVVGTQAIINACAKHKVEKLIYISTDEVYGSLSKENSWMENHKIDPGNVYSVSKAAGEMLVQAAYKEYGLIYNIIRCANTYGPRQTSNKIVPKTIKNILNNEPITILESEFPSRDWIHVFDTSAAILQILNNSLNNEIYNVSSGQEITNEDIILKICDVMNSGHNLITNNSIVNKESYKRTIDSSKIQQLGWKPTFKFKDGIAQTIDWYLNNQWFLK